LESQFDRRYCQTFSTGFNSGAREGSKIGVMLDDQKFWLTQEAGSGWPPEPLRRPLAAFLRRCCHCLPEVENQRGRVALTADPPCEIILSECASFDIERDAALRSLAS
jgi:hypothetical protein